jgi:hypothetical protein
LVADRLHGKYGSYLARMSCTSLGRDRKGNYNKKKAVKRDGEEGYHRRWCCTTNGKFGYPSVSNAAYIDWAKTQLSRDSFRTVVETIHSGFEDKGPEHCRLGLLLQGRPSPPTERRLDFFTSGGVLLPVTSVTSSRIDEGVYVTPASSTLGVGKVGLIHAPYPGLSAGSIDIRFPLPLPCHKLL